MGGMRMDGPDTPLVESVEEMLGRFQAELLTILPGWKERLGADPGQLRELERDVHAAFSRWADLVIVGLVAVLMKSPAFDRACECTRRDFGYPLESGRERQVRVRLLGGLLVWVTSLYCAPRKSRLLREQEKVPGVYLELTQLGFGKGCTPGLQSKVARQAALFPSLQFAKQDPKTPSTSSLPIPA